MNYLMIFYGIIHCINWYWIKRWLILYIELIGIALKDDWYYVENISDIINDLCYGEDILYYWWII